MKKLLCLLGGAMLMSFAFGQNKHSFRSQKEPFYIGSYFNMKESLGKTINYKDSSVCLEDFKGKIIILDFWHTGCSSCLNAFPAEVGLQKRFGDQIQIIAVTHQSDTLVESFLKKWDERTGIHLNFPIIVNGSKLQKAFRFRAQPHYVWIRPDGYIAAQSSSQFVTEGNIKSLIKEWKKLKSILYGDAPQIDVFSTTNSK